MTLHGIDASSWQSAAQVEHAMAGKQFLIHKASEGTGFKDPAHDARVALARSKGWRLGHYHFAHPANSASKEAAWFLRCANPRPGDVLALDLEKSEGSWHDRLSYARAFLSYVRAHTGSSPWIYLNTSWLSALHAVASTTEWADLTRSPLWLAYWPYSGKAGTFPRVSWPVVTCQQYADHPVTDQNVLFGDGSTWDALAVPKPAPKPAPKPPTPKPLPSPPSPLTAPIVVKVPGLAAPVHITLEKL